MALAYSYVIFIPRWRAWWLLRMARLWLYKLQSRRVRKAPGEEWIGRKVITMRIGQVLFLSHPSPIIGYACHWLPFRKLDWCCYCYWCWWWEIVYDCALLLASPDGLLIGVRACLYITQCEMGGGVFPIYYNLKSHHFILVNVDLWLQMSQIHVFRGVLPDYYDIT